MKLHKKDLVQVMAGKDRGRQAEIATVFPKEDRILLPGINQYKKHRKKLRQGKNQAHNLLTQRRNPDESGKNLIISIKNTAYQTG